MRKKSHKTLGEINGCAPETFSGTDRLTDTHGQTSIFFLSNTLALSKQTLTFNTHSHNLYCSQQQTQVEII